jgi:RIO kinase 1
MSHISHDEYGLVFNGTRQERLYVTESLGEFYEDQWFGRILYKVKAGKEASVYCCCPNPPAEGAQPAAHDGLIAAKVYRPRMFRAMHNDWFYKQGRTSRDPEGKAVYRGKDLRAARQDTRTGQKIDLASWCHWEYDTLQKLHEAGADVPRPLAHAGQAILMEYIGDESMGAPTLHAVRLAKPEAAEMFERLLWNLELALSFLRIHADFSAHNVLYWEGRAVIIDWPQAVEADRHPSAFSLLLRDIERLCQYFVRYGIEYDAGSLARDLWQRAFGQAV